jgi:type VI secretion system secreted protein Hcp
MASDYLLEIDGIEGESQDTAHPRTIEISSYGFGESHAGSFASGTGGGTGKVAMQDMNFTAQTSKASPNLFQACASGKHIKKATLYVRKATGDGGQLEYYKIELTDVVVSSCHTSGTTGGDHNLPTDQFSLNYAKIEQEYKPQDNDGRLGAAVTAGWDVQKNTKP